SRFFPTADESVAGEDDVQRKQQKPNSRKELGIHFEEERSGSRSWGRRRVSSFGKEKRMVTFQRSNSYSSDDSSDIDAVVAAAALVVTTADSPPSSSGEISPVSSRARPWTPLPRIGEDPSRSRRHYDEEVNNPADSRALMPSTSMERRRPATPLSKDSKALVPVPSRKDSKTSDSGSGRWDKQIAPSRSDSYDNKEGSGRVSRSSSENRGKEKERERESRKHKEFRSDQGKRDQKEAKAAAWLEEEIGRIDSRYDRKYSGIREWEEVRRHEADMKFKEVENRLMEKRMVAFQKKESAIQRVHKKAEEKRSKLNGRRETEMAK
ncbi:hypothetical protein KI387_003833, partial [Taxus chinensis]